MSMTRLAPSRRPVAARDRSLLAAVFALGSLTAAAAPPSAEDALKIKPRQSGVDCDTPAADAVGKCTIAQEKVDGVSALVVRGPAGEIIRAFSDTNGDRVVDQWRYFKDGVEVYRDLDSDNDTKSDQCRWFNSAGTRWATVSEATGALESWKAMSPEEATAELVTAIRGRDEQIFRMVLATRADLEAAGFSGDRLAELAARAARAAEQFPKFAAAQKQVGDKTRWSGMLAPQGPGVIPSGSGGTTADVTAYDNVVALVETPGAGGAAETGQVFVGSLVRCGQAWKLVDLPQIVGAAGDIADAGGFFGPRLGGAGGAGEVQDEKIKPLVAKLQAIERKMAEVSGPGRGELAIQQVAILEQVLAACADGDRGFWTNQLVETLAAYVQEGIVPDGVDRLEKLAAAAEGDERLAAFIAFRLAQARYAARMQEPGVDGEKLQSQWFDDLTAFVEKHPQAPEAAEALLQLGFRDEFEGREQAAIDRYTAIAKDFSDSPQARKAAGAVRRLQSVGKPLALAGAGVDGKAVDVAAFRGVPVVVHWWSTECEPCKVDLAQIRELQGRYGSKKLAVVGVALDGDKAKLLKFLEAKPIPWPQVHEPGGLDSRLAEEFGVLALPTMFLVDGAGNVVDRNVSITDLEKKIEALVGGK